MTTTTTQLKSWLRKKAVIELLGTSSSTLDRMRNEDKTFPKPVQLSARTVAWDAQEIHNWMESKLAQREAA